MVEKPSSCQSCSFRAYGAGFMPVAGRPESKVYVIHEQPSKVDAMKGLALQDWFGEAFMDLVARPLGVPREVFTFDHTIRCKTASGAWPEGERGKAAASGCRRHDGPLWAWGATVAIPSYSIHDIRMQPTTARLIQAVFEKAFRLAEKGERPVVLCGMGTVKAFLPFLPATQEWKSKSFLATWQGAQFREGLWKKGNGPLNAMLEDAVIAGIPSNPSIDMIIARVRAGQ